MCWKQGWKEMAVEQNSKVQVILTKLSNILLRTILKIFIFGHNWFFMRCSFQVLQKGGAAIGGGGRGWAEGHRHPLKTSRIFFWINETKKVKRRTRASLENFKIQKHEDIPWKLKKDFLHETKRRKKGTTQTFLENPNPKNRRKWAFLESQKWRLSKIQKRRDQGTVIANMEQK